MYPPRLPFATDVTLLQVLLLIYDTEDGGGERCSEAQRVFTLVERIHQKHGPSEKQKHRQPLVDDTNPADLNMICRSINRSLGLAVPIILLYAFSLALQTYVLRLDVIVAIIGLVFVGFEGLLSIGTAVSFYHAFRG